MTTVLLLSTWTSEALTCTCISDAALQFRSLGSGVCSGPGVSKRCLVKPRGRTADVKGLA